MGAVATVEKHAGGRPTKYKPEDIAVALNEFIDNNDDPIIVEFCCKYGISSTQFYVIARDNEQLSSIIKRATDKCEAYLVRNAQNNKINPVFAMFRLKQRQFGWSDKQEIELTGANGGPLLVQDVSALSDADLERLIEIADKLQIQGEVVDITPLDEDK